MPYQGNLNANEIFATIYNMIISQTVHAPFLVHSYSKLLGKFREEGGLAGDTKLYYDTDILSSYKWTGDNEAANLLAVNRPADPKCQAITISEFRQIALTVDQYLSKRAFSTEGAFSQMNAVFLGWLGKTKEVYDNLLINTFTGTHYAGSDQAVDIVEAPLNALVTDGFTGEELNRLEAGVIGQTVADLLVEMKDYGRDFNKYGFFTAYGSEDLFILWNSKWVNKIRKVDLPTIFNNSGIIDKFEEEVLPAKYFGVVVDSGVVTAETYDASSNPKGAFTVSSDIATVRGTSGANKVRSLVEKEYTVSGTKYHVFPGEELKVNATISSTGTGAMFAYDEVYVQHDDIICKVIHNDAIKFMTAFSVSTNFFNSRSLTENHYLTWGYSKPEQLNICPVVTVEAD